MADAQLHIPSSLGRFRIDERLGSGGMGEVYKAFDPKLHRTVALKTVRPHLNAPAFIDRLRREAEAAGRLQHQNIVSLYDIGEVDGTVFIAMEYLKGSDLSEVIASGALSFEQRINVLTQILGALHYAHGEGVIHRDIKPGNIHLLPDGTVKLLDFGIARVADADSLTHAGTVLGTPHYASPEQLNGEAVDARSDVYSTGALAYELLCGRKAFEADSLMAVMRKVLSDPPPPMNTLWSRTFPDVERIVCRAMAKPAADRYVTAEEMRAALAGFLDRSRAAIHAVDPSADETMLAGQAPAQPPRDTRWWIAAAAAAALVIGVAGMTRQYWVPSAPAAGSPSLDVMAPGQVGIGASAGDVLLADLPDERPVGAGTVPLAPPQPGPAAASEAAAATGAELVSARQLFLGHSDGASAGAGAVPTSGSNAGLRYRLIQKTAAGDEIDVDPQTTFRSGDRVRFAFESNLDGFLYVIQEGSSGRWAMLFPHPQVNGGRNAIEKFRQYTVPENGWWVFDQNPGTEKLFVFLSREPVTQLPGVNQPVTGPQTVSPTIVAELDRSIKSRDLVFEQDKPAPGAKTGPATYIVNRDELGKSVAATIQISHGQ